MTRPNNEYWIKNKKCKRKGCFETAVCSHGYCKDHCPKRHAVKPYSHSKKPRLYASPAGVMGIELEVIVPEGNGKLVTNAHHDGSLSYGGVEIKCCGKDEQVGRMAGKLLVRARQLGATVDRSCGFHVHLDVRGVPAGRIADLFAWAYAHQDWFFGLVPPSRRNNQFCTRLEGESVSTSHYSWLSRSYKYETVEIRLHPATTNEFKVCGWAEFCMCLGRWVRGTEAFPENPLDVATSPLAKEYVEARIASGGSLRTEDATPSSVM